MSPPPHSAHLLAGSGGGGGLFGATATSNSGSLFGGGSTSTQSGGLFGQPSGTSSFLKPSTSTAFGTSGGFGSTTTSTGGGGLFGGGTQPTGGGLFGSTAGTTTGGSLFGQQQPAGGGLFGGGTAFGTSSSGGTTSVKFSPLEGTDNMVRNGQSQTVKTKHYCITGMKQYEAKSLEVSESCGVVLTRILLFTIGGTAARVNSNTLEPDLVATEMLAFPSISSRSKNDSDLTIAIP